MLISAPLSLIGAISKTGISYVALLQNCADAHSAAVPQCTLIN